MNYQEAIRRTIPEKLERDKRLSMLCMGLSGETGEVIDHCKKHLYQGHALDRNKVIDEAGDVLWYLTNLLTEVGATLEEVQDHNIKKLAARYPNGFEAERSVNREEEKPNLKKCSMSDIGGQVDNWLEYTKDWKCEKCMWHDTPSCTFAACFQLDGYHEYASICGIYKEVLK